MSEPSAPAVTLPSFVAIGEALTDLVAEDATRLQWRALPGGSVWNVARAMAALGQPSAFAGAFSKDVFGDALSEASTVAGLDPRFLQRYAKSPLLAVVHSTQPPRYFFIGDDSADLYFNPSLLPVGWPQHARWAHFGGISLAREPLASRLVTLAAALKQQGVRICYDPNFRALMDARYDVTLRHMVELADVVKVSDEDLAGLFRDDDIAASLASLRGWNPTAKLLLTRGAQGASLHIGSDVWHARPPRIQVVDSVGAGDASIAALLYSLMHQADWPPQRHLEFAVAAGAAACLSAGAEPPTLKVVQSLI